MRFKAIPIIIIILLTSFFTSCDGGKMEDPKAHFKSLKDIPASAWEKLTQKAIFFGHQSVGNNIMAGIQDLMKDNPQIKLNIVESFEPPQLKGPIFVHNSNLGKNHDPKLKMASFSKLLHEANGPADIAFMKFCFVDIDSGTDIDQLFAEYKDTMSQLAKEFPKTTFIHFTVPLLRKSKGGVKAWIKKLLGKEDTFFSNSHNIARNRFNELIRKEYQGNYALFDIAEIESTYPDGTRETFTQNGKTYYSLIPNYSDDGGHLNVLGRKRAAEILLVLLLTPIKD